MAKLYKCKSCNKVAEMEITTKSDAGSTITTTKCPKCGHEEKEVKRFQHWGDDKR